MRIDIIKPSVIFAICLLGSLSGCGAPASNSGSGSGGGGGGTSGGATVSQSGSTAAMLVYENAIYALDGDVFKVLDIASEAETKLVSKQRIEGAETLFIYGSHLYIGGQFGVDIWNIDNALEPVQVNFYSHARACDPIIVDNDIGYITLRNRWGCDGDINRLEIVDFTSPTEPKELFRYPMKSPVGLAKMGSYLAVCQERYGLSVLDVNITESEQVKNVAVEEVANFNEIHCFDVIYNKDVLLVTAEDGIYQLAVDGYWLSLLSRIPVGS